MFQDVAKEILRLDISTRQTLRYQRFLAGIVDIVLKHVIVSILQTENGC